MSKKRKTYTFSSDPETILITHYKKHYRKHRYFTEQMELEVIPNSSHHDRSETIIDSGYRFRNFENIGGFYNYIKKNKKKDIVHYDSRGFLVFKVITEDGQEIQTINLMKFKEQQLEDIQNKSVNFQNPTNNMEVNKYMKEIQKNLKELKKTINTVEKSRNINPLSEIIFSLTDKQSQFLLNQHYPIFRFPFIIQDIVSKPFKIKLKTVNSDKVFFGIKLPLPQREGRIKSIQHYITFKKSFECSYPIQDGNSLQVSLQQGDFVIKNVNNQTGLKFEDCLGEQHMKENGCIFITLKQSSI